MPACVSSPPPRSRVIRVQSTDLHCLEWGVSTHPPVLLLHGGAAHAHWWDHIAPAFARNYRVLALDLRGHGDSGWVVPPAYEVEHYLADLEEVVAALGLTRFVLFGHSLGGFVALAYALTHLEVLRALVVVDIGTRLGGNRFMRLLRSVPAPVYKDEADLLRRFRPLPVETSAAAPLLRSIARQSVISQIDGCLRLKCDRATLVREPRDLTAQVGQISCPTLFIRGKDSTSLPAMTFHKLLARCPHAHGVEIAGAGHHVFLDQPQAFIDVVQNFLDEVLRNRFREVTVK